MISLNKIKQFKCIHTIFEIADYIAYNHNVYIVYKEYLYVKEQRTQSKKFVVIMQMHTQNAVDRYEKL